MPAHFNSTDNSDMHRFATFGRSSSANASFATASILVRLDGTARRLQTANMKKILIFLFAFLFYADSTLAASAIKR